MSVKSIYDINKEIITELFDYVIFYRGEEYKDEGCVRSIEAINAITLTGVVQGNQNYVVSITIDEDGDILCDCSCPCDFNCKHAVAILLKWISSKEYKDKSLHISNKEPIETLDQVLMKKSKDDLILLIKLFIERYPELTLYVNIDAHKLTVHIQRLFSEPWDWHDIDKLISELESILQGIQSNKNQWNKTLVNEMKTASQIMIDNVEDIDDNGEFSFFLDEWFQTYGEIFSTTNPTKTQKIEFIWAIMKWMKEVDFDLDYSYQQALLGMCADEKDVKLVTKYLKSIDANDDSFDDYSDLILQMYDKLGLHNKYIHIAMQYGHIIKAIEKLMQIKRFDEALDLCEQSKNNSKDLLLKKVIILKELERYQEWHQCLIQIIQKTGQYSYVPQLKQASTKNEWTTYREVIINDAKEKQLDGFLSRLYYDERDYKKAYEYATNLSNDGYLELLATKLSKTNPTLACNILKKLCFDFINQGSGWPYKKAGSILRSIKKIDKNNTFFQQTKKQLIEKHKKKYSLMKIIKKI